jgi:hypothetical protein
MNHLMGIEHDKDAVRIPPPPEEDFDQYEDDGGGPGPSIHPMTPCWDDLRCEWNWRLYELFMAYLEAPAPDGREILLDEENRVEIHEMFFERLRRLKREITAAAPKSGEKSYQARERVAKKKKETLERQRPNTRRQQVSGVKLMAKLTDQQIHSYLRPGLRSHWATEQTQEEILTRRGTACTKWWTHSERRG